MYSYMKRFTNKNKAAVIELVGELPEEGKVYKAYEKGEKQYELDVREEWDYKSGCLQKTRITIPGLNIKKWRFYRMWRPKK